MTGDGNDRFVHVDFEDTIGIIRLDRPPANALESAMVAQLAEAVQSLEADRSVQALLFTGTGDCFSAGLDVKIVPNLTANERRTLMHALGEVVAAIFSCSLPTVAAVNGHAVAAGSLLCLCTDYRIAPDANCRFGFTGPRVGIPYPDTAMTIIRSQLAPHVARRMLLGAATCDQDQALADGLIDEVVPPSAVMARSIEVATDLASIPTTSYAAVKLQVRGDVIGELRRLVDQARRLSGGTFIA